MYIVLIPEVFLVLILLFIAAIIAKGSSIVSDFAYFLAEHWLILFIIGLIINVVLAVLLFLGWKSERKNKKKKRNIVLSILEFIGSFLGVTMFNSPCTLYIFGLIIPSAITVDGIMDAIIFVIWILLGGVAFLFIGFLGIYLISKSIEEKNSIGEFFLFGIVILFLSLIATYVFNLGDIESVLYHYYLY